MDGLRAALPMLAGPALIVSGVAWALRDFLVRNLSTSGDIVRYWLPMYAELGRSLRAGNVLAWTPHVLGGMPFAADPHSGWLQVVPMTLFAWLPADRAAAWLVAVHPMIAGLGLYAFLRTERLSRAAATVGGLAIALVLATTRLAVAVRFPGALAWTAVALACAARAVRAPTRSSRAGWLAATALAWGQIAASHITVGLGVGTVALAAYLAAVAFARRVPPRRALAWGTGFAVGLVMVGAAILLPRVAFAGQTSLAVGYDELSRLSERLTGAASPPIPGFTAGPGWLGSLAGAPGPYLGAGVLCLAAAAWLDRRRRPFVVALTAVGTAGYVATLGPVARALEGPLGAIPGGDQYLHAPEWLVMAVLLTLAVLAGVGLDAARSPGAARVLMGTAVALAALGGITAGSPWFGLPLLAGVGVLIALLGAGVRRPAVLAAVPVLVAVEILAPVALLEDRGWGDRLPPYAGAPEILRPMKPVGTDLAEAIRPSTIVRAIAGEGGRMMGIGRPFPPDPRALVENESQRFGLEGVNGYRAVQLARFWTAFRALHPEPIPYNQAQATSPNPVFIDLMAVRWLVIEAGPEPFGNRGSGPAATDGSWRLSGPLEIPRATLVGSWRVVEDDVLGELAGSFDPSETVLLEEDPGLGQPGAPGDAGLTTYGSIDEESARVEVHADRNAVLLVRTTWDRNWRATVDGRAVRVLPANGFVQAVPVTAGTHVVVLRYEDPWIRRGLAVSAAALLAIVAFILLFIRRGAE